MGDRSATIVVAADDTPRPLLVRVVEDAGHRAVEADPAAGLGPAVGSAGATAALIDLGPGGAAALADLRDADPACRVVVLAAGPAAARQSWQGGADAVLVRPFPVDDLRAALTAILDRPEDDRDAARAAGLARLDAVGA